MQKHNLQADYSINGSYLQLSLPFEIEYLIPVDESVRLLDQVLEELDYQKLYLTYSAKGRNPAVQPKTLFKIMVYAYSQGIYSSREIERACRLNLAFRYLLQGQKVPDHNTISRFRHEHLILCAEDLLNQLVFLLHDLDEIQFKNLFVDGTKIEANANKYTFVWKKSIEKYEVNLQEKVRDFFNVEMPELELPKYITSKFLKKILHKLKNEARQRKIVFVYGKGKRKTPFQRKVDLLTEYFCKQSNYEVSQGILGKRNSYSKTDKDATFMHMKEDHMRNGQLKPGYNVQVAVESEYIVGIDVSCERNDLNTLVPFLKKLAVNYGRTFENLIADAGYESIENYEYLKKNQITSYIKPSNYEYSKTKKFQKDMEFRIAMEYDTGKDMYTCKNGKQLTYRYDRKRESSSGYISHTKVYECESCSGCPYLGKCYKGKTNKRIEVSPVFDELRAESRKNITSEKGNELRVNRSIQAEGVFGVTKQDYGFTRFLTRGKANVTTEYMLLALGFNINKLHNRIQKNRLGQSLFLVEETA